MRAEFLRRAEQAAWRAEKVTSMAAWAARLDRDERKRLIAEYSQRFISGLPEDEQAALYHAADQLNRDAAAMRGHYQAVADFDQAMRDKYGDSERWPDAERHEYVRLSITEWLARQLRDKAAEVV